MSAVRGSLTITPAGVVVEHYAVPYHLHGQAVPTRERRAPFASCDGCEFVCELDATPAEAAAIMRELHELTSQPAPLEDCPFTLSAPSAAAPRITQPTLFGDDNGDT